MFLKIFITSSIILLPAVLGIGIKLFFNKNSELPTGCCGMGMDQDSEFTCACGMEKITPQKNL